MSLLPSLPPAILALRGTPWLHEAPGLGFVLAPSLRAWARGFGACPAALQELVPPSLAMGDPPDPAMAGILAGAIIDETGGGTHAA